MFEWKSQLKGKTPFRSINKTKVSTSQINPSLCWSDFGNVHFETDEICTKRMKHTYCTISLPKKSGSNSKQRNNPIGFVIRYFVVRQTLAGVSYHFFYLMFFPSPFFCGKKKNFPLVIIKIISHLQMGFFDASKKSSKEFKGKKGDWHLML